MYLVIYDLSVCKMVQSCFCFLFQIPPSPPLKYFSVSDSILAGTDFKHFFFLWLCVSRDVYCTHPYFPLCAIVLVISPAVNHCLHPSRPEDMQTTGSLLSHCSIQHQSLLDIKASFFKDVFLKPFQRLI